MEFNFDISGNSNSVNVTVTNGAVQVVGMLLKFFLALIGLLLTPVIVPVLLLAQRGNNHQSLDDYLQDGE